MQTIIWNEANEAERRAALMRPQRRADAASLDVVQTIFAEAASEGAAAVTRWAKKLDGRAPAYLELTPPVVAAARTCLSKEEVEAIEAAIDNVRFYHEATKPKPITVEMRPGVRAKLEWRPIETCGLYIPNGTAPLVSTLIMLAEPARVAGVPERVIVTPPGRDGKTHPAVVAAAAACGLDGLWLIGGAQAIAALALGVVTPRADKIFGPGNVFVNEAKRLAASMLGGPAIDLPAGPSELLVIADRTASARLIAADLLAQAEHDADAQVLLITPSRELIDAVVLELWEQRSSLPRSEIVARALAAARFIEVDTMDEAIAVANTYAPEHLSLQADRAAALLPSIKSAGAVFVGAMSAETFGDYIVGPSHVLPTDRAGGAWSGVTTASFMRSMAVQELDGAGAAALQRHASSLARLEGLEAHARAADFRLSMDCDPQPSAMIRRRIGVVERQTKETSIAVRVDLDAPGPCAIRTGVGFLDHMLEQVAHHGGFSLEVSCIGDIEVDPHHSIEDCALAFGQALSEALGDRRGIARFGFLLPMDEAEAKVSFDLGGRPYLVFNGAFNAPMLGAYPTEMTEHVFRSLSQALGATVHVAVTGENDHHKTEACFKALGRALRQAIRVEGADVPSTKGVI